MSPTADDEWLRRTDHRSRRTRVNPPRRHARRVVRATAAAIASLAVIVIVGGQASATWSIVATDKTTGQVGAAVASCVEATDQTSTMALVPSTGGAVTLGNSAPNAPALLAAALRTNPTPPAVVRSVRTPQVDAGYAQRQYGVAMLGAGATAGTGAQVAGTAGAVRSADGTATVQGNLLASRLVLDRAAGAYERTDGPLAARLLAALQAGARAGGDRGCGEQARSAALVVLGPDSALYVPAASATTGDSGTLLAGGNPTPAELAAALDKNAVRPAPTGPDAPAVHLSVVTDGRSDAIATITTQYAGLTAAEHTERAAANRSVIDPAYSQGLTIAAIILFCVVGLILAALIIAGMRRADRRAAELRTIGDGSLPAPYRSDVANLFDLDLAVLQRVRRDAERRERRTSDRRESAWSGRQW